MKIMHKAGSSERWGGAFIEMRRVPGETVGWMLETQGSDGAWERRMDGRDSVFRDRCHAEETAALLADLHYRVRITEVVRGEVLR